MLSGNFKKGFFMTLKHAVRKVEQKICPICNKKGLWRYENYVICPHCGGAPLSCGDHITLIDDSHPHEVQTCPRCGASPMTPANGHLLFLVSNNY